MRVRRLLAAAALLGLGLSSTPASANGQISHLRVSQDALAQLPDCDMAQFLGDPARLEMLDNGTMYPDGGYGPVNNDLSRDAAEYAHWEPFQDAYRRWIDETFETPTEGEGGEYTAFYFGMASHGMADQVFDSLYGERVRRYDPSDLDDLDQFLEYVMVEQRGPFEPPADWVPYDVFPDLYAQVAGWFYPEEDIAQGQLLLRIAINALNALATEENVQTAHDTYPWGSENLLDPTAVGGPTIEAEVVARYWMVLWDLVHEQPLRSPVLWTWPRDGGVAPVVSSQDTAEAIEGWVTLVFARGLDQASLSAEQFEIVDADGMSMPFELNLYYGNNSHVVHLRPTADLQPGTVYTVRVQPNVATIHGDALEGFTFAFATEGAQTEPLGAPDLWDTCDAPASGGTSSGGEPSGTTTPNGDDSTSGLHPASTTSTNPDSSASSPSSDASSGSPAADVSSSGCGCQSPGRGPSSAWLWLLAVTWLPRRPRGSR